MIAITHNTEDIIAILFTELTNNPACSGDNGRLPITTEHIKVSSPKTIDLSTVGGIIHLTNKDKEKILEDIETIKQIEQHEIEKIFDIES